MRFNLRDKIIIGGKTYYIYSETIYLYKTIYELIPEGGGEVIEISLDRMILLHNEENI
jgi:hypothetical protein